MYVISLVLTVKVFLLVHAVKFIWQLTFMGRYHFSHAVVVYFYSYLFLPAQEFV